MGQKPPARKNTFVIVAALLFNLLWITLLFLSCQADNQPGSTPTQDVRIEKPLVWKTEESVGLNMAKCENAQTWGRGDLVPSANSVLINHSVPLYSPPSTCSITPVI